MSAIDVVNQKTAKATALALPDKGLAVEKIDDRDQVIGMMEKLFANAATTGDVRFQVDDELYSAHRAVLAARSPALGAMLCNDGLMFKEGQKNATIPLPGKRAVPFEHFLRYCYTGKVPVADLELDTIIEIWCIAQEYQVAELILSLASFFGNSVNAGTVVKIANAAFQFPVNTDAQLAESLSNLVQTCRDCLLANADMVLSDDRYTELSEDVFADLILSDELGAPEVDILFFVAKWRKANPDAQNVKSVIENGIRFKHVSLGGLSVADAVPLYTLLFDNQIDLKGCQEKDSLSRTLTVKNAVTKESGASADGVSVEQLTGNGFTYWRTIDSPITIKLPTAHLVRSMRFHIQGNAPGNCCSYRIETSKDGTSWKVLIEMAKETKLEQLLIFRPRRFQYVRICGTISSNSVANSSYFVVMFQCPPTNLSKQELDRFNENNPSGNGVVLYQHFYKSVFVYKG